MKSICSFITYLLHSRFRFFSLPLDQKACILNRYKLYFFAGRLFYKLKDYPSAAQCFEQTHAYKHLIDTYQKQGLYSKAIEIADTHHYYELGIKLCKSIGNTKKRAYFYSFVNPSKAAKLYIKDGFYYEAGLSYLKAHTPLQALSAFEHVSDPQKKQKAYNLLNEYGSVLYLSKQYEAAFKLFMALKDYYSVLECAKKMNEPILLESIHLLIAATLADDQEYLLAGKYLENSSPRQALFYYAQGKSYYDMIRLLISEAEYTKAINVCYLQNNLELANEIAETYIAG